MKLKTPKLGDILRVKVRDHVTGRDRTIDDMEDYTETHLVYYGRFIKAKNGYWIIESEYDDLLEESKIAHAVMSNCIVDVKKLGVDKEDLPPRKGGD